jgi:hypothetical protein
MIATNAIEKLPEMTTVGFILLPHPLHRWVSGVEPQHRSWCWVRLHSPNLDISDLNRRRNFVSSKTLLILFKDDLTC